MANPTNTAPALSHTESANSARGIGSELSPLLAVARDIKRSKSKSEIREIIDRLEREFMDGQVDLADEEWPLVTAAVHYRVWQLGYR